MTVFAGFVATDIDALFGSEDRLVKFKGKVFPKIGAALSTATAAPPATKNVPKPKILRRYQ
jgi:hypothetical protein